MNIFESIGNDSTDDEVDKTCQSDLIAVKTAIGVPCAGLFLGNILVRSNL